MPESQSERDPETGRPVGPQVDAKPARWPERTTLKGRFGRVEPLSVQHVGELWRAVERHDELWPYMSAGPFTNEKTFSDWIRFRIEAKDSVSYAIVDSVNKPCGVAVLMEIRPEMRVIEVGSILYAPALQRTPLGTEAQYLLARYAFEALRYRRYEWKCNALNAPPRRAALRYGFTYEGILRAHMVIKGRNRDTAYFSMLDSEWPSRKAAFEKWLSPENLGADGRQKKRLEELRT